MATICGFVNLLNRIDQSTTQHFIGFDVVP